MKLAVLLLSFTLLSSAVVAQPPLAWTRHFPGGSELGGWPQLASTADGNYFLTSPLPDQEGVAVTYLDSIGDEIWTSQFSFQASQLRWAVAQTPDHGLIVAGCAGWPERQGKLLRLDNNGIEIWRRTADGYLSGVVVNISDSTFLTLGGNEVQWPGSRLVARRWSLEGDQLDSLIINESVYAMGIIRGTGTNGYLISATGDNGVFFLSIAANLSLNWRLDRTGSHYSWARSFALTPQGNILLLKYNRAIQLDTLGNEYWDIPLEISSFMGAEATATDSAGNMFVLLHSSSGFGEMYVPQILKITPAGTFDWSTQLDQVAITDGGGMTVTPRGNLMIAFNKPGWLWGDTYRTGVVKFCVDNADAAHARNLVSNSPGSLNYALVYESGAIQQLVFATAHDSAWGEVLGDAAANWQAVPNGDGNNGDSVIFTANVPFTEDSVATFVIHGLSQCRNLAWSAGCRRDSISIFHGVAEFDSVVIGDNTFSLHLQSSVAVRDWALVTWHSDPAEVDTHLMAAWAPPGWVRYDYDLYDPAGPYVMPIAIDSFGCVKNFPLWQTFVLWSNAAEHGLIAYDYALSAYPNPFNSATEIQLYMPKPARSVVSLFDLLGRHVATLYNGVLEPGEHRFTFDASALPSGIYFARVQAGEFVQTQKLLLLK